MKYIAANEEGSLGKIPVLELTRRNLEVLLAKLGDPASARTIVERDDKIAVRAVPDDAHYSDRPAGAMYMPSKGEFV